MDEKEIDYSRLLEPENKAAFRTMLIAEVKKMLRSDAPRELFELIPSTADSIVNIGGVSELWVAELAYGPKDLKGGLCRGCKGECCRHCDPIGVTYDDAKRLALARGMQFKSFVKTYLIQHPTSKETAYAFAQTRPCQFLNEDGRCNVYASRPGVCELYPITIKDGKIGIALDTYCRFSFNAAVYQCDMLVFREYMSQHHPAELEKLEDIGKTCFPTKRQMKGMSQQERLASTAAGNRKFAEIVFGSKYPRHNV